MNKVVHIDERQIQGHLDRMVLGTVEQPPSSLTSLGAGAAPAVIGLILQRARPQFTAQ